MQYTFWVDEIMTYESRAKPHESFHIIQFIHNQGPHYTITFEPSESLILKQHDPYRQKEERGSLKSCERGIPGNLYLAQPSLI